MQSSALAVLLAPQEPFVQRLGVLAVCLVFAAWMIFVGRYNVRMRDAEETGQTLLVKTLLGKSTAIKGRAAVVTGWIRIIIGVAAIVFGFLFFFYGAWLKK